ncbi:peptide MFS transporter [Porticoccus sp. GXU_MW_L64]
MNTPYSTPAGHPRGLYLLFATEMWERFSFYGMRAVLVLTLIASTESNNPGFGWTSAEALKLYGWYTGFVYFTPIIGAWVSDHFWGQRRSVIVGGVAMASGQFVLAASIPGNVTLFYTGLVLLIIGNGFFKPNISTMVGELYSADDPRRDSAFTLFYMGINLGAFIAPLVCSTLAENPAWGWKYGYLAAGVGMTVSVIIQALLGKKLLGDVGVEPAAKRSLRSSGGVKEPLTKEERERLRVIFMIFAFVVVFWASYEQGGGLMNIFALEHTDRFVFDFEVPAGWLQSLPPLYVILLAPVISLLWTRMGAAAPSTLMKMVIGLFFTAVGFMAMMVAAWQVQAGDQAAMIWLVIAFLFLSVAELCISPVGLSMVTRLSPLRLSSVMMGVWFLTNFAGNLVAGYVGALSESAGALTVFTGIVITNVVFAIVLWLLSDRLVRWMHLETNNTEPSK